MIDVVEVNFTAKSFYLLNSALDVRGASGLRVREESVSGVVGVPVALADHEASIVDDLVLEHELSVDLQGGRVEVDEIITAHFICNRILEVRQIHAFHASAEREAQLVYFFSCCTIRS